MWSTWFASTGQTVGGHSPQKSCCRHRESRASRLKGNKHLRLAGLVHFGGLRLSHLPVPCRLAETSNRYRRGYDTMDVWFDSGSSWRAVVQEREGSQATADVYLEGSDQHRGWFQSSLLTSVVSQRSAVAPYHCVVTHGFVVDGNGHKMSKSLKNGVDPRVVIEGGKNLKREPAYGTDLLRTWVASST